MTNVSSQYRPILDWVDGQSASMTELLIRWAKINTHSFNLPGLRAMTAELQTYLRIFQEPVQVLDLPPVSMVGPQAEAVTQPLGQAIKIQKRPSAPRQILCVIHMDTVYPCDSPFQQAISIADNVLQGPGVADAKGGIVIMLTALQAFERFPLKDDWGWTVVINPDEEIGSPGSQSFLQPLTRRADVGLLFEPSLPDGDLVGDRKGSGNFTLVVRGRSAHAGRNPESGRNAIETLARCIGEMSSWNGLRPGLTVNVGVVGGGKAVNVVPDRAFVRFNARIDRSEDEATVMQNLQALVKKFSHDDGISLQLQGEFGALPKRVEGETLRLYQDVCACGRDLGLDLHWQPSGGVSDGNRFSSWGLANVDSLGARGGNLHSDTEFLYVDSLTERAKLSALVLMKLAAGEITVKGKRHG